MIKSRWRHLRRDAEWVKALKCSWVSLEFLTLYFCACGRVSDLGQLVQVPGGGLSVGRYHALVASLGLLALSVVGCGMT